MTIQEQRSQCLPPGNVLSSPDILSDFYIKNHHYVVIRPASHCELVIEPDSCEMPPVHIGEVIGQIRLNNQLYSIREVEANLDTDFNSSSQSNVAELLTARELQIVQLIAQGHANKQVARRLHISEWTVSTHVRRVFAKLSVDSRAAMVYRCALWLLTLERLLK